MGVESLLGNLNGKLVLQGSDLPVLFGDFYEDYDNYSDPYDDNDTCCISTGTGTVCDQNDSMAFEAVFKPVLYTLAVLVGFVGNGLVLAVLWQKRRTWNVTDTFILHLAISDSLLLLTLPFWAVEASQGWIFGTGFCKIAGSMFQINFYCGIFLLACISVDRYMSIVHAVQMYSRKKPWAIQASCLTVWFACLVLSIPDWLYLEANYDLRREKTECMPNYPTANADAWKKAFRWLYHILGFFVPSVVMVFCYTSILLRLSRSTKSLQRKRAMRVILALVVAFFVSWTPYNLTLIADTVFTNQTSVLAPCGTATILDISLTVTSTLGYMHCCVNPLLYAFVGVKFRRHLVEMLKKLHCPVKSQMMGSQVSRRSSMWSETDTTHTSAF
ncbi:C-X-C chemokine receptor type 3.1 [Engraulis encrasicolus]|uniref:C-X-C chemokine receptor type 3.1 n=1 Tax=Engraulis encrasicolus TaxID=184585 RepID=UPI002FD4C9A9